MRRAKMTRKTGETDISVTLCLDGVGRCDVKSGIGFFDHMLEQFACHSLMDLVMRVDGDLHIDDHHSVEDCGIVIGQALMKALGGKVGIRRYGQCNLVMDDAQVAVALDLSSRPFLSWNVTFPTHKVGHFDTELAREFFQALTTHGGITLHIDLVRGVNSHHIMETAFKAVARALRVALEIDPRVQEAIPSTKGTL